MICNAEAQSIQEQLHQAYMYNEVHIHSLRSEIAEAAAARFIDEPFSQSPAAPCEASPPHRTASHSAGPEMAPDVAEAMRELAEMEACGLRVAWPG